MWQGGTIKYNGFMEPSQHVAFGTIISSVRRARIPILTIALTYGLSVLLGILMVDFHVHFALDYRDRIVNQAYNGNNVTINALQSGNRLQAALSDFGTNLLLGAVPNTIGGLGIFIPYPIVAFRGWVGGIVSVDQQHVSRLARPSDAIYYLVTLLLQLIPYSLAGGAGVMLGLSFYKNQSNRQVPKWIGLPKSAVLDVFRIYCLIVPLFLVESLWEFLMA
jgi:hypothetical protein